MAVSVPRTDDIPVEGIIHGIVDACEYAVESRIHNVLYLAELETIEENPDEFERLTTLPFKKYFNGAYSEDLHRELERLVEAGDVEVTSTIIDEREVTVYHCQHDDGDEPDHDLDRIEAVCAEMADESAAEVTERVKHTWLYQHADFDEEMDFAAYYEYVH